MKNYAAIQVALFLVTGLCTNNVSAAAVRMVNRVKSAVGLSPSEAAEASEEIQDNKPKTWGKGFGYDFVEGATQSINDTIANKFPDTEMTRGKLFSFTALAQKSFTTFRTDTITEIGDRADASIDEAILTLSYHTDALRANAINHLGDRFDESSERTINHMKKSLTQLRKEAAQDADNRLKQLAKNAIDNFCDNTKVKGVEAATEVRTDVGIDVLAIFISGFAAAIGIKRFDNGDFLKGALFMGPAAVFFAKKMDDQKKINNANILKKKIKDATALENFLERRRKRHSPILDQAPSFLNSMHRSLMIHNMQIPPNIIRARV